MNNLYQAHAIREDGTYGVIPLEAVELEEAKQETAACFQNETALMAGDSKPVKLVIYECIPIAQADLEFTWQQVC